MSDVVTLPKYTINGRSAEEEATRLHFLKNQPDRPELEQATIPPYRFRPYPTVVYREGPDQALESRLVGVLDYDEDGLVVPQLRARNEQQHRDALNAGWVDRPDQVKSAIDQANKAIAMAAAERTHADRHLGEKARAELDAIEAASDGHVVEVPVARKKPGRKPKPKLETPV